MNTWSVAFDTEMRWSYEIWKKLEEGIYWHMLCVFFKYIFSR